MRSLHVRRSARIAPGDVRHEGEVREARQGGPNPFIDPEGYKTEIDVNENVFKRVLAQQQAAAK